MAAQEAADAQARCAAAAEHQATYDQADCKHQEQSKIGDYFPSLIICHDTAKKGPVLSSPKKKKSRNAPRNPSDEQGSNPEVVVTGVIQHMPPPSDSSDDNNEDEDDVEKHKVNKASNESNEDSKPKAADLKGPNFDSENSLEEYPNETPAETETPDKTLAKIPDETLFESPTQTLQESTDMMPVKPLQVTMEKIQVSCNSCWLCHGVIRRAFFCIRQEFFDNETMALGMTHLYGPSEGA
jgi:hypothetical protein